MHCPRYRGSHRARSRAGVVRGNGLPVRVYSPPTVGGSVGVLVQTPPTRDGLGGSNSPPRLPPTVGGSTPQAKILRILVQKPCVLTGILSSSEKSECSPPQWGGVWGGAFWAEGGSGGGAFLKISEYHFSKTPPHSGGESGGEFLGLRGGVGGALPPWGIGLRTPLA